MTETENPVASTESTPTAHGPYSAADFYGLAWSPHRALDVVLAQKERLTATLVGEQASTRLAIALVTSSVTFALPFGFVIAPTRPWVVSALYLGALAICLPSLLVFSAFLGIRLGAGRIRVPTFALLVSAVAALFTFGFFPIQWFLGATMLAESKSIGPRGLALGFLGFALLAGMMHLLRCLRLARGGAVHDNGLALIVAWQFLLGFIAWRMALALELA